MYSMTALKDIAQLCFFIAGSLGAIGAAFSAIGALRTYRANSRLEAARWTVRMYEKFYEHHDLKKIRDALDCPPHSANAAALVAGESPELTDYLNFFELLAVLEESKQMSASAIEGMFGYYLDCIQRQRALASYVADDKNGFEKLRRYLRTRPALHAN